MPTIELTDTQVRILRCATNNMDLADLKIDMWVLHEKVLSEGELGIEVDDIRSKLADAYRPE
jgi:hypothetical protein